MSITTLTDDSTKVPKFKVSLRSTTGKFLVVFDVTPTISESRAISYDNLSVTHMPGSILVYKNTDSRAFSLTNVKLISRTPTEARKNLIRLNILKAWGLPYFGTGGKQQADKMQTNSGNGQANQQYNDLNQQLASAKASFLSFLGAPPDVLYLSAYAGTGADSTFEGNINSVPVVMTNLDFSYPSDVDYIPVGGTGGQAQDNFVGTPFPAIMELSIQLKEIHSAREYQNFSLDDYRRGDLSRF